MEMPIVRRSLVQHDSGPFRAKAFAIFALGTYLLRRLTGHHWAISCEHFPMAYCVFNLVAPDILFFPLHYQNLHGDLPAFWVQQRPKAKGKAGRPRKARDVAQAKKRFEGNKFKPFPKQVGKPVGKQGNRLKTEVLGC